MQTSHKRKKAFTLTELLVVVIVIGVLSAVVLPKFSKVVETRKTTEAEELMSAVRTEQEKRCALDKSYVTSLTAVKDIVPSGTSKNYAYSLTSTGMEAQSKGKYGYTLKMPSYADGRICCENEAECAKLNKDYPLCSALMARADYRSGAECAGEPEEKQCTGSSTQSCGCNNGGTQTRTCDTSTGTWSGWSACSISDACECTGTKPEESQTCNDCGTQTRSVTCDTATGQWKTGNWNTCSKTEAECTTCPEGKVLENGVCVCEESWEKDLCSGEVTCGDGSTSVLTWNEDTCQCEDSCPKETTEFYNLVCGRTDYWKASTNVNTHPTLEAARNACEKYGQNVSFCVAMPGSSNCSDPNKPCEITQGWGKCFSCSQEKCTNGGLGTCSTCDCTCYIG
ncbi:prepilin-type N-terminal cleavage/methylation domain-containing protein [Candidatus Avelusimicrobium alvi]|uniref:prepilin-type N-terminal cleavage/methylation domain-containing protein n=2 Tax=Candidatus Avelusimicrobium alvi TaxID=3416221 RepID=UPI003D0A14EE